MQELTTYNNNYIYIIAVPLALSRGGCHQH